MTLFALIVDRLRGGQGPVSYRKVYCKVFVSGMSRTRNPSCKKSSSLVHAFETAEMIAMLHRPLALSFLYNVPPTTVVNTTNSETIGSWILDWRLYSTTDSTIAGDPTIPAFVFLTLDLVTSTRLTCVHSTTMISLSLLDRKFESITSQHCSAI
jgi:hypothetical protein